MVFAKTSLAASFLCEAWREKSLRNGEFISPGVEKVYLAMVREWPPFQVDQNSSGIIDLPLEPSGTERLKWRVAMKPSTSCEGIECFKPKHSQTKWKVLCANHVLPDWCYSVYRDKNENEVKDNFQDLKKKTTMTGIVLELRPITGRTHQLRVHCAHVGSGIVGDSLYGKDRIADTEFYDPNEAAKFGKSGPNLLLHASELTFPRPPRDESDRSTSCCSFASWPSWYCL
jgi:23S rRNA-/tRNA-specific pseudouridylate synthase